MYNFYIKQERKIAGPFSACELQKMGLSGDTPVSEQNINGGQWMPLSEIDLQIICEKEKEAEPEAPLSSNPDESLENNTNEQIENLSELTPQESGQTEKPNMPTCLNKWNWGAFAMPVLWGLFNGIGWPFLVGISSIAVGYLMALKFSPDAIYEWPRMSCSIVSIIMGFYLGNAGNRLAWKKHKDEQETLDAFERKQKIWNIIGIVLSSFLAIGLLGCFIIINS